MLSFDTLAVTIAEADTYCTARGIADWTGADALKSAALRRGQDYIAGAYNTRWTVGFDDATAPNAVKYAIIEAATREIKVPFSLTPDLVLGREKVLTEVKGIKWTPAKSDATAADLVPFLTSIRGLLRGVAAIDAWPGAFVA
jgi:hypothetical protein